MPATCPRFERVLVHSAIMPQVSEFLRQHGLTLQPADDIRDGPVHILTVTPRGAQTLRGE